MISLYFSILDVNNWKHLKGKNLNLYILEVVSFNDDHSQTDTCHIDKICRIPLEKSVKPALWRRWLGQIKIKNDLEQRKYKY